MILLQLLLGIVAFLVLAAISLWIAGALYFDVGRESRLAWALVVGWLAFVVVLFQVWQPWWQPALVIVALFIVFLFVWLRQKPSNDRPWNPNYAVLASVDLDGDRVTVHNVRNTEYRTLEDFTPRYEDRSYRLSKLRGLDVVVVYWGSPWICHPMLVFDFGEDGRLCISVEVRYREGQEYGLFRSLYRQQEIIYVFCDERDAILLRTRYWQDHQVYLYRLNAEIEEIQKVFLEYVVTANELVDNPRWYHGIFTNCTTSVYKQRAHQIEWDWRWLFNGKLDEMLYDHQRLNTRLPFEELKHRSLLNEIANRAPIVGFGDFIRRELEVYELDFAD